MLTKLDIVNAALAATGMAPVASIDSKHPAFLRALGVFERVNRSVQTKGYWFNKYDRVLTPGSDGTIVVPQSASNILVYEHPELIIRGNRLYDRSQGITAVFGGPIRAQVKEILPVEDLPDVARDRLTQQVIYEYYLSEDGQDPKLSEYRNAADIAAMELNKENLRQEQVNRMESKSFLSTRWPYAPSRLQVRK